MLVVATASKPSSGRIVAVVVLFLALLAVTAAGGAGFYVLSRQLALSHAAANDAQLKADAFAQQLKAAQERDLELKRRVDALAVETATLREKNAALERRIAAQPAATTMNLDGVPQFRINGAAIAIDPNAEHVINLPALTGVNGQIHWTINAGNNPPPPPGGAVPAPDEVRQALVQRLDRLIDLPGAQPVPPPPVTIEFKPAQPAPNPAPAPAPKKDDAF